jgi:hypothetical protein
LVGDRRAGVEERGRSVDGVEESDVNRARRVRPKDKSTLASFKELVKIRPPPEKINNKKRVKRHTLRAHKVPNKTALFEPG